MLRDFRLKVASHAVASLKKLDDLRKWDPSLRSVSAAKEEAFAKSAEDPAASLRVLVPSWPTDPPFALGAWLRAPAATHETLKPLLEDTVVKRLEDVREELFKMLPAQESPPPPATAFLRPLLAMAACADNNFVPTGLDAFYTKDTPPGTAAEVLAEHVLLHFSRAMMPPDFVGLFGKPPDDKPLGDFFFLFGPPSGLRAAGRAPLPRGPGGGPADPQPRHAAELRGR